MRRSFRLTATVPAGARHPQRLAEALRPRADGHIYLVDVDIEKFFDTIPHEPLIDAVAERVADGSVLRLIRLFLEALIQDGYRLVRPKVGTPQSGVVSLLLANIYLARITCWIRRASPLSATRTMCGWPVARRVVPDMPWRARPRF